MPIESVWYNPPDVGWVVEAAWKFHQPIDTDPDDKFQTKVRLSKRPQYHARLHEELEKLSQ